MKRKFDNGFQYIIVCTGCIKTITSCDFNGWGYQYILDNNQDFAIHEHELINRIKDGRFCIKQHFIFGCILKVCVKVCYMMVFIRNEYYIFAVSFN